MSIADSDNLYCNAFALIPCLGPIKTKKLRDYFTTLKKAWQAGRGDFIQAGIEPKAVEEIFSAKNKINPEKEFAKLEKEKVSIIPITSKNYPRQLKEIYAAPSVLYVRGEIKPEDKFSIGVVGSRKPTPYGKQATDKLSSELAQTGLTIISGLAYGIDAIAHQAAIKNSARTIAVLGSGIGWNDIYPQSHKKLAEKIIENGAVISEYPIGAQAQKHTFPARNRIVSGLSLGVLVVEAAEKSGALITAAHALSQNREVFAVPGSIYSPYSAGPNGLIKAGAKLVASCADIFEELNIEPVVAAAKQKKLLPENEEEALIFNFLSSEPLHIDAIAELTKLDTTILNATLSMMELSGKVKNIGGMQFILTD